jgi:hypothetical protein
MMGKRIAVMMAMALGLLTTGVAVGGAPAAASARGGTAVFAAEATRAGPTPAQARVLQDRVARFSRRSLR